MVLIVQLKGDELRLSVVIAICVDGFFEAISAGIVISSNSYCAGLATFPTYTGFNYGKRIHIFHLFWLL
jgi:hypothetical protein